MSSSPRCCHVCASNYKRPFLVRIWSSTVFNYFIHMRSLHLQEEVASSRNLHYTELRIGECSHVVNMPLLSPPRTVLAACPISFLSESQLSLSSHYLSQAAAKSSWQSFIGAPVQRQPCNTCRSIWFFLMLWYRAQVQHATYCPSTNYSWNMCAVVSVRLEWLIDKLQLYFSPVQEV